MAEPEMTVKGTTGIVLLYPNKFTIKRKGLLSAVLYGGKGDMTYRIDSIQGIIFKEATLRDGYFQPSLIAAAAASGGYGRAMYDENTVSFNRRQQPEFEKLRDIIEERVYARQATEPSTIVQMPSSVADEIEKLAALRDKGILTTEEFEARKKQVLGI